MNKEIITTQFNYDQKIKDICGILRSSGLGGALEYIPELTWILFLKFYDDFEYLKSEKNKALGKKSSDLLEYPYRWRDWANKKGKKRIELENQSLGSIFKFINDDLIPKLKNLKDNKSSFEKLILSQILINVEKVNIDTEKNFLDVIDKIDEINLSEINEKHIFPISQAYEGLLLRLGDKAKDGGQYFTPREVIRFIVKVINPKLGETMLDPSCGTGGFLVETMKHLKSKNKKMDVDELDFLSSKTCYGKEKTKLIYPILLANLMLHSFKNINVWYGNSLTKDEYYGGLYKNAPENFDIILTNPPFGGKENDEVSANFPYKTKKTQFLFLQDYIDLLKDKGRAGSVVDEGILFRTDEKAFIQIKRKLLEECNLYCIISLPPGVFKVAGGNVKTNIIFFKKGEETKKIYYYDLSTLKVTKKKPMTLNHFDDFFVKYKDKKISKNSWFVDFKERKKKINSEIKFIEDQLLNKKLDKIEKNDLSNRINYLENKIYDLSAQNPNDKPNIINKTSSEIINDIEKNLDEFKNIIQKFKNN